MTPTKISHWFQGGPVPMGLSTPVLAPDDVEPVQLARSRRDLARRLFHRAAVYLHAVQLETSLVIDTTEMRTLRLGLLQDFVEIHNAALHGAVILPEGKDELRSLLDWDGR